MNDERPFLNEDESTNPSELPSEAVGRGHGTSAGRTAPPRQTSGGLGAVIGQLFAVALGGVTVFGIYFLFLDDLLKKPPQAATRQEDSTPVIDQSAPHEERAEFPEAETQLLESDVSTPVVPVEAATAKTQAERELAGERALGLARKMLAQNPAAAERWFRKVVTEHKGTQAAQSADDWLKTHATKP